MSSTAENEQSLNENEKKDELIKTEKNWPTRLQNGELPSGYYLELEGTKILSENEIEYNVTKQWHNEEILDENILLLSSTRTWECKPSIVKVIAHLILSRYENLKWLELIHVGLEELTANMFECVPNLKQIDLSHNKLTKLKSGTFKHCKNVDIIWISDNEINELDEDVFDGLENLNWLILNNNKITHLTYQHLQPVRKSLCRFYITNNLIEDLDENLFRDHVMTYDVRMSHNKIKIIPKNFFRNTTLTEFDLDNNEVEEINPELFLLSFDDFNSINLGGNKIREIHPDTFKQKNITSINLSRNQIEKLHPDTFASLTLLKTLKMKYNNLAEIDENLFKNNSQLYELNLRGNKIKTIHPHAFDNLTEVHKLALSENCIEELPKDLFSKMRKLSRLYLEKNQIKFLPPEIFKSNKFEQLLIDHNKIDVFEQETFKNLGELIFFGFRDNPGSDMIDKNFLKIFRRGKIFLKERHFIYNDSDFEFIGVESLIKEEPKKPNKDLLNEDNNENEIVFGLFN